MTPMGVRTRAILSPFGRVQRISAPTGSGSAATVRTVSARPAPRFVQPEPVDEGRRQGGGAGVRHVARVGLEDGGAAAWRRSAAACSAAVRTVASALRSCAARPATGGPSPP
jgi:hypothetical protein